MKQKALLVTLLLFSVVTTSFLLCSDSKKIGNTFTFMNIQSSDLTRSDPIVIDNNADFPGLASFGDGSAGTPWLIENKLIECNDSGVGISITGTTEYAIFRNCVVNESGSTATDAGIVIQASRNIIFDQCESYAAGNIGLAMIGCGYINITDSSFHGAAGTLYGEGSWEILIDSCEMYEFTVTGGIVFSDWLAGNGSTHLTITNNTISISDYWTSYKGLHLDDVEDLLFEGNSLINCTKAALYGLDDVEFIDNDFIDGYTGAIDINSACDGLVFDNNNFSYTKGDRQGTAIGSDADVTNCNITNNIFDGYGIGIDISGTNILIENNALIDEASGIEAYVTSNCNITNNEITDIGNTAITTTGDGGVMISSNTIADNVKGIDARNTGISLITNNTLRDSYSNAMVLILTKSVIASNDIRYVHDKDLIEVGAGSSNLTFEYNYLYSPGNDTSTADAGIWFDTGACVDMLIQHNTFDTINDTSNGNGILCYGADNLTIHDNSFLYLRNGIYLQNSITDLNVSNNGFLDTINEHINGFPALGYIDGNSFSDYFTVTSEINANYDDGDPLPDDYVNEDYTDENPIYRDEINGNSIHYLLRVKSDDANKITITIYASSITRVRVFLDSVMFRDVYGSSVDLEILKTGVNAGSRVIVVMIYGESTGYVVTLTRSVTVSNTDDVEEPGNEGDDPILQPWTLEGDTWMIVVLSSIPATVFFLWIMNRGKGIKGYKPGNQHKKHKKK